MMTKLLNRRLVYLESSEWDCLMPLIEEVDEYLSYSKSLESVTPAIIVYGDRSKTLLVGREVVGHDSQLKHHDRLKLKDFDQSEVELEEKFTIKEYDELVGFLSKHLEQFDSYRVETSSFSEFSVSFFKREK